MAFGICIYCGLNIQFLEAYPFCRRRANRFRMKQRLVSGKTILKNNEKFWETRKKLFSY